MRAQWQGNLEINLQVPDVESSGVPQRIIWWLFRLGTGTLCIAIFVIATMFCSSPLVGLSHQCMLAWLCPIASKNVR